jgi:tetratricopeptide (TPR) repeat protein
MGIPKKDSYSKIVFAAFCVLVSGFNALAQEIQPVHVLIDSYKLPDKLTPETAEKTISELNRAFALCTDDVLKYRIEYRVGMIYFKAGDLAKAASCFEKISQTSGCPDIIKFCSLNMAGQIYRMQAKDDEALKAFEELIKLSQEFLAKDSNQESPASILKLAVTAGFAKAEIYQYNQDYNSAITEYKRIAVFLLKSGKASEADNYASLALDRMSQFYLMGNKVEDYNQTAIELIEKYPDYYRTGIVKLETKAVKILKKKDASIDFPRGSFDAPARLITLIKDSGDKEFKNEAGILLKDLSSQYRESYGGILVGYHYAWLLDALGEQKQATEVLEDINKQAVSINIDMPGIAQVIGALTDYARIQQAIILGEENRYKEALEIVCSLKTDPNDVHLSNLADSSKKTLETLKREVPKDVNVQ